jgi:hypothetical protein
MINQHGLTQNNSRRNGLMAQRASATHSIENDNEVF